jgi:hypothetical protein
MLGIGLLDTFLEKGLLRAGDQKRPIRYHVARLATVGD